MTLLPIVEKSGKEERLIGLRGKSLILIISVFVQHQFPSICVDRSASTIILRLIDFKFAYNAFPPFIFHSNIFYSNYSYLYWMLICYQHYGNKPTKIMAKYVLWIIRKSQHLQGAEGSLFLNVVGFISYEPVTTIVMINRIQVEYFYDT